MSSKFETEYRDWLNQHIARSTGERLRRLKTRHGFGEKCFLKTRGGLSSAIWTICTRNTRLSTLTAITISLISVIYVFPGRHAWNPTISAPMPEMPTGSTSLAGWIGRTKLGWPGGIFYAFLSTNSRKIRSAANSMSAECLRNGMEWIAPRCRDYLFTNVKSSVSPLAPRSRSRWFANVWGKREHSYMVKSTSLLIGGYWNRQAAINALPDINCENRIVSITNSILGLRFLAINTATHTYLHHDCHFTRISTVSHTYLHHYRHFMRISTATHTYLHHGCHFTRISTVSHTYLHHDCHFTRNSIATHTYLHHYRDFTRNSTVSRT